MVILLLSPLLHHPLLHASRCLECLHLYYNRKMINKPVSKTKTECEKYISGFNQETLTYVSVLIIISHVIILF